MTYAEFGMFVFVIACVGMTINFMLMGKVFKHQQVIFRDEAWHSITNQITNKIKMVLLLKVLAYSLLIFCMMHYTFVIKDLFVEQVIIFLAVIDFMHGLGNCVEAKLLN